MVSKKKEHPGWLIGLDKYQVGHIQRDLWGDEVGLSRVEPAKLMSFLKVVNWI